MRLLRLTAFAHSSMVGGTVDLTALSLASPSHRTCFPAMSLPCCAVRHGEATVIATAMDFAELELLSHSDNAAAKMLSSYMYIQFPLSFLSFPLIRRFSLSTFLRRFSQTTADMPQWAFRSLTARHMAMTSTFHTRPAPAQDALAIGPAPVGTQGRRPGQGDGATRARDAWPSVLDCAAASDRRARGPVD